MISAVKKTDKNGDRHTHTQEILGTTISKTY